VHPGGSFRKHGQTWIEEPPYAPGKHFQFREFTIDKDYVYLVDESRRNKDNSPMLLRFPIHGGFLQWSFQNPTTWTNLYLVKPEHDQ
jgi:hypothetical protein